MAIAGALHGLRTRGGFNVEVKLDGDWFKFSKLMNTFGTETMAIATAAQHQFAEEYKKKVKENIRTGGKQFGYPEHSSAYSRYKSSKGGPGRLFYWSGALYNSVDVMRLPNGRLGVGIPKNAKRGNYPGEKGTPLSVSEYANILEHGTRGGLNIPARPIFSDTFKQNMGGKRGLQKFMADYIYAAYAIRGLKPKRI